MEKLNKGNLVWYESSPEVLILIIMEDTHGDNFGNAFPRCLRRLNPYYNGRYSWSMLKFKF